MAFFYYTLWPIIRTNFEHQSQCSKAICEKCTTGKCEYVKCHLEGKKEEFECVYKG